MTHKTPKPFKPFSNRPKSSTKSGFTWKPGTYEDVLNILEKAYNGGMPQPVVAAITYFAEAMHGLECPAPSWDQKSLYRVALVGANLALQRKTVESAGAWEMDPHWIALNPNLKPLFPIA
ncbi:hypothetical protein [Mesoterricola silvestris]|uniref:hypothetical protein n=1 Tax=Mesoterricola silvestris TaxID=2927979 RepID=UPI002931DCB5|nr:hypothetical protein [Mesoterricola silvestris]